MAPALDIVLEIGLNVSGKRGIDYYYAHVIDALADVDQRNRYVIFSYFFKEYARKKALLPDPGRANFKLYVPRVPESLVLKCERRWKLPVIDRVLLRGRPVSVYHSLGGGRLPFIPRAKTVLTFFDLAVEAFPADGRPEPGRKISDPMTYEMARRADCLMATGDYTKRDLMRYYGVSEAKIAVIPTGVNLKIFRPVAEANRLDAVRRRYGLPARFLIVIGPFEPPRRTNADVTLEAFAQLRRQGVAPGCRLVFVGGRHPNLDRLLELARGLGLGEEVHCTGYVALEDLPAVYSLSEGVVHPTSVEGFGFGMEVMACGTPFVTSDLPGVVEAVGEDALTVPPRDVGRLAQALEALLTRPELRASLRAKGLARAERFSYRAIAERLVALYERLASGA